MLDWMMRVLSELSSEGDVFADGETLAGVIGQRLGEMHAVLAKPSDAAAFAPERADKAVIDRWGAGLETLIDAALRALEGARAGLEACPRPEQTSLGAPGEHWGSPAGYPTHNFLAVAGPLLGNTPYLPPVHADLTPGESASEITAGSPVWTGDRQIGHVIEVLTDEKGNVRELVIAREGVLGAHVVIPLVKVIEVVGSNVQVDLNETDVDLLEPFPPPPDR